MLAKRIIPCLDVKEGRVVKGVKFLNLKDAGDPVESAILYDNEKADELVFLDITASSEKRNIMLDVVKSVADAIFIPFTVGGGIRTLKDIDDLLSAGCDKISINSAAVINPNLINESAKKFGSQCIVVAIDAKLKRERVEESALRKWEVVINGGRISTGKDAVEWAIESQESGAGEILLTSMDTDGTNDGFDIPLNKIISENVKIPVIASGGAGKPEHFLDIFCKTKVSAALAASIFHYNIYSVKDIKNYLLKYDIPVRKA